MPTTYGYARVSTNEQKTESQMTDLEKSGCSKIIQETFTGATRDRPRFNHLLTTLLPGDTLVVWKLDRLSRSLTDLLHILDLFKRKGVFLKSIQEPFIDTTSSMGEFIIQILGAVAQLERQNIITRTRAGMEAARRNGVKLGKRGRYTETELEEAYKLICLKGLNIQAGSEATGISPHILYKYTKRRNLRLRDEGRVNR